jgi:protein TonB
MNHRKHLFILLLSLTIFSANTYAQDTAKNKSAPTVFSTTETAPEYPGGAKAFYKYIGKNLRYPEAAITLGLSGKVVVSFIIEKDGEVSTVTPISCLGAGCESEAARVISAAGSWQPGFQNGKPVRVQYTVPITFNVGDTSAVKLKTLKRSDYGFFFFINGKIYSVDDAESILGKTYTPSNILTAEPLDDPQYAMPDKKAVYLIVMK